MTTPRRGLSGLCDARIAAGTISKLPTAVKMLKAFAGDANAMVAGVDLLPMNAWNSLCVRDASPPSRGLWRWSISRVG